MRDYSNITIKPFQGPIQTQLIDRVTNDFIISCQVDWYGSAYLTSSNTITSMGVRIDLDFDDIEFRHKRLRSVFIDNTNVPFSVELFFPDSLTTISCGPYSTRTASIFSNGNAAILYNIDAATAASFVSTKAITSVVFSSDIAAEQHDPFILHKASAGIKNASSNTPYDTPAIADQLVNVSFVANIANANGALWLPPVPLLYNFLYIHSLFAVVANQGAAATANQFNLETNDTVAGVSTLFAGNVTLLPNTTGVFINMTGLNIRIRTPSTLTNIQWRLASGALSASLVFAAAMAYSTNRL